MKIVPMLCCLLARARCSFVYLRAGGECQRTKGTTTTPSTDDDVAVATTTTDDDDDDGIAG